MPRAKKKTTQAAELNDVRMDLMSSRQVQSYLRTNDMVVLPVGCFEMHGPDVPLGCDSFIDWAMALLLARQWKCPCMPPVHYTFPGASGPWPGTTDIPNRVTMDYIEAIVLSLIKGGFKRIVVSGSHGPLGAMMQCVLRNVYQSTGHAILHVQPYGPIIENMKAMGVPYGEPGVVLASMKLLGVDGYFDPASTVDRPCEFPLKSIADLRRCAAAMPWIFAKDYQHTGINSKLKASHADKIIAAMEKAAQDMKDLPRYFARYQRDMAKLEADKPWSKPTTWTKTKPRKR